MPRPALASAVLVASLITACGASADRTPVSQAPCTYRLPFDVLEGSAASEVVVEAPGLAEVVWSSWAGIPEALPENAVEIASGSARVRLATKLQAGRYEISLRRDDRAPCGVIDAAAYAVRAPVE